MSCDEIRVQMPGYWSQALAESEDLAFQAHLAQCESCRTENARLGAMWRTLIAPADEPGQSMRPRFYAVLDAYRQGAESAPPSSWRERLAAWWPKQPVWQVAIAGGLMVAGLAGGYGLRPSGPPPEMVELKQEVAQMRQMLALSLLQQPSASERLRGVSWAYRAPADDIEVVQALVTAMRTDPSVNVRLAAVDALRAFGANPAVRTDIVEALPRQDAPIVQVALIDLLVDLKNDLKNREAEAPLRQLASNDAVDSGVRERALWAIGELQ